MVVPIPADELPWVFLLDEKAEQLKEFVLCGPQHLPNMMKELVLLEERHLDHLQHCKILIVCCVVTTSY